MRQATAGCWGAAKAQAALEVQGWKGMCDRGKWSQDGGHMGSWPSPEEPWERNPGGFLEVVVLQRSSQTG